MDVNFLMTKIPVSTIGDINKANKLVRDFKKWKHVKYKIHPFAEHETLELAPWTDAAWANRPNGKDSTEFHWYDRFQTASRTRNECDSYLLEV